MTRWTNRLGAATAALVAGSVAVVVTWAAQTPPAVEPGDDWAVGGSLDWACNELGGAAVALAEQYAPGMSVDDFYQDLEPDIAACQDAVLAGDVAAESAPVPDGTSGINSVTQQGFSLLIGALSAATAWLTWDRTRREPPRRPRSPSGARGAVGRSGTLSRRLRKR